MYDASSMQLCLQIPHLTLLLQNRDFGIAWVFFNCFYMSMLATSRVCSDAIFACQMDISCYVNSSILPTKYLDFGRDTWEIMTLMIFLASGCILAYVDIGEASKSFF